jgi:hypothetical protein
MVQESKELRVIIIVGSGVESEGDNIEGDEDTPYCATKFVGDRADCVIVRVTEAHPADLNLTRLRALCKFHQLDATGDVSALRGRLGIFLAKRKRAALLEIAKTPEDVELVKQKMGQL